MSSSPIGPERVGESAAKWLLERASRLDEDTLTLHQLREAAIEAGIAPSAFDEAVREWQATRGLGRSGSHPLSLSSRLLRNAAAIAAGWAAVAAFATIDRFFFFPWLVHKLTDPVGLALGAVVAWKLRARNAITVLGGLTVSQLTEFVLDFASGTPAVHGFGAHIGLMMAGIAGVALGQHFWSRGQGPGLSGSDHQGTHGSRPIKDAGSVEFRAASA